MSRQRFRVEVVYARAQRQVLRRVELDAGATAADAVAASGLWTDFPELDANAGRYARHGRLIGQDARLSDGDRFEVLRPLIVDPKVARRQNAARSGRGGAGTGSRR